MGEWERKTKRTTREDVLALWSDVEKKLKVLLCTVGENSPYQLHILPKHRDFLPEIIGVDKVLEIQARQNAVSSMQ
jgi:hypothetical protein